MLRIDQLTPGALVQHYKGGMYTIVGSAKHTENGETLILYRSTDDPAGQLWARPAAMFLEHADTPNGPAPRFRLAPTTSAE